MYLSGADDKLTVEVTATPTTPLQVFCSYKVFSSAFRRVVDLQNDFKTLANTSPVTAMGEPSTGERLALDRLVVMNKDNVTRTVVVKTTNGTATTEIANVELEAGFSFVLDAATGSNVFNDKGRNILEPIDPV
jgi:hypothetical protein